MQLAVLKLPVVVEPSDIVRLKVPFAEAPFIDVMLTVPLVANGRFEVSPHPLFVEITRANAPTTVVPLGTAGGLGFTV